ncbi:MAG: hypothetical protein JSW03_08140 [Candidatus Eiseniibacteriota bacterium]|nr:MAG: hypothetical protein JSW03_08140 [Candidatus Eisenbacteria bacterium]
MSPSSSSGRPARRNANRRLLLAVSSRRRLRQRFGPDGLDEIQEALGSYKGRLAKRRVTLEVAFVDDASSMTSFGLKPTRSLTAPSVKKSVDRLVAKLAKPPGTSVSLLIIGGGEVIPYFKLSNPTFDSDSFVPSDNPYGCGPGRVSAEKCLLPERSVGRMPDGDGKSLRLLLDQINRAPGSARAAPKKSPALGYTASVWRRVSQEVWNELGWRGRLRVSPPLSYVDVKASWFGSKRFLYFNLHGSDREPYWFGQKGAKFTTAFSPANVRRFARPGAAVLTEACYGAIEMKRRKESSIALAFLGAGSLCVLGSTSVAYGALVPPMSEADLIAFHFFRNVLKGLSLGEALVSARAHLVASALSTQGYLDEDDRKTLLQFVLFGDPTATVKRGSPGK